MATATHYDAFDFLEHVVNRALQPRSHAGACTAKDHSSQAACGPQAASQNRQEFRQEFRQETRLIRMNVSETDLAYLVAAELPGVSKEDVEVVIEGKDVSLQAVSKRPETLEASADKPATERLLMGERFYGKLTRRIQLPQEIDETTAEARFVDGILHLQLPKKKVQGVRKLDIQ